MKNRLAIASFTAAVIFGVMGMTLPPMGIIDGSVNFLIAQLLVLCATLLGVESFYDKVKR